jgi:hypothetical protein
MTLYQIGASPTKLMPQLCQSWVIELVCMDVDSIKSEAFDPLFKPISEGNAAGESG